MSLDVPLHETCKVSLTWWEIDERNIDKEGLDDGDDDASA